jgi:hypothetical protein
VSGASRQHSVDNFTSVNKNSFLFLPTHRIYLHPVNREQVQRPLTQFVTVLVS